MLDFWQWAALIGVGLGFLSVAIKGVGVWRSARQICDLRRQTTTIADLASGAEDRARDLKDRLDGAEGP